VSPPLEPHRGLTLLHATSLVVGITIGTGIFLKSAVMAQEVGTPALVLAAWVVAGVFLWGGSGSWENLAGPQVGSGPRLSPR
jgi:APA family basic amino acid/polyamine antiporter